MIETGKLIKNKIKTFKKLHLMMTLPDVVYACLIIYMYKYDPMPPIITDVQTMKIIVYSSIALMIILMMVLKITRFRMLSSDSIYDRKEKNNETPFSKEPLLLPRQQVNTNEVGRVIKIVDEKQKLKFLNYMSVKSEFSCEEINFIESFYKDNINYFFIINNKDVKKSFANVEIDKMTYRFDYPGDVFVEQQKI